MNADTTHTTRIQVPKGVMAYARDRAEGGGYDAVFIHREPGAIFRIEGVILDGDVFCGAVPICRVDKIARVIEEIDFGESPEA